MLTARGAANVALSMTRSSLLSRLTLGLVFAVSFARGAVESRAADVTCGMGGDQAGHAVAAGTDFDGDGIPDVAVGAPCARVATAENAGRVFIHSGATGGRILTLKGNAPGQKFGGALAFIDDFSGDGIADLIVGSPGAPAVSGTATKEEAGRVEIFTIEGDAILTVPGAFAAGNFGEAVAGLGDYNGDDVPELLVGAGGDRDVPGGERYGAVYLLSGKTGAVLDTSLGEIKSDRWGAAVGAADDVNDDGIADVLVSSNSSDAPGAGEGEENHGLARILSGADFAEVLATVRGDVEDKLGKSSAMVDDLDNDGISDFAVGAPGVKIGTFGNAGVVSLHSGSSGDPIRVLQQPAPQVGANFGTAVANLGFINGDSRPDIVASAPSTTVDTKFNVGRIHLFSGSNGNVIWTADGFFPGTRFGQALAPAADWDGDGRTDVAVGNPGDAFRGRRGAGTVRVLSGHDGEELVQFGGRSGLETRIFVSAWNLDGAAEVRALTNAGRQTKQRQEVLRGVYDGTLALAVIDDGATMNSDAMKLVSSGGTGSGTPVVEVTRAGRRRGTISRFVAEFSAPYAGGVHVAGGELALDEGEEIAVVQADSATGNVELSVYSRADTDPFGHITWGRELTFPVFTAGERIDSFLVNATGANVVAGALGDDGDRLVVTPVSGAPVVRVLDGTGLVTAEWLAYSPSGNSGTTVAVGRLGDDGVQIVTAPQVGQLRIRAFNSDGSPYISIESGVEVDFVVPGSVIGNASRFRLVVADIDLDDRGEILVVTDATSPTQILAFEIDGTRIEGWPNELFAYQPLARWPIAISATDRFVRR